MIYDLGANATSNRFPTWWISIDNVEVVERQLYVAVFEFALGSEFWLDLKVLLVKKQTGRDNGPPRSRAIRSSRQRAPLSQPPTPFGHSYADRGLRAFASSGYFLASRTAMRSFSRAMRGSNFISEQITFRLTLASGAAFASVAGLPRPKVGFVSFGLAGLVGAIRRLGKIHREAAGAEVAPKLLAKKHLDIRFVDDDENVVDDENKETHVLSPALRGALSLRFCRTQQGRCWDNLRGIKHSRHEQRSLDPRWHGALVLLCFASSSGVVSVATVAAGTFSQCPPLLQSGHVNREFVTRHGPALH
jgi:hypothetical protein